MILTCMRHVLKVGFAAGLFLSSAQAAEGDRAVCESSGGDDAIAACTRLIEGSRPGTPDLGLLYYLRGVAHLGKYQQAPGLADLDKAIELNTSLAEAYVARAGANRFNNKDKERMQRVLADYTKAIELKPHSFDAHYYRGTFEDWQKDYVGALADYDKALEVKPNDVATLHMRARLYQHLGDYQRALADREALVRLDPWEQRLLDRAGAYLAVGDYDRALADFDAYEKRPHDPAVLGGRAGAFEGEGDYARALAEYNEAISIAPGIVGLYDGRAWTYYKLGKLQEGLADVDNILSHGWKTAAATYCTRGHILEALGRKQEAIADLRTALAFDPDKRTRDRIDAALGRLILN